MSYVAGAMRSARVKSCTARTVVAVVVGMLLVSILSSCSSGATRQSSGAALIPGRPTGAAASLSGPVKTGHIIEPISPVSVDLAANGYVEQEFFASGTAAAYGATRSLAPDGKWLVKPQGATSYRTRIVVRRPSDPHRFNGTVLVEWLNVSGGVEAPADWAYLNPELVRDGYAYVAVSAQAFGIDGGKSLLGVPGAAASSGLVGSEPARYGSLHHPGDRFSFDMYSQIGLALRTSRRPSVFGNLSPRRVVAIGESQSAFFLTTYIDAIQPRTHAYDGFFVHSRSGGGASLSGTAIGSQRVPNDLRIRSDVGVPVFMFETETDVGPLLNYGPARQPDTNRIHTWEVAGTAHADAYLVGSYAPVLGCNFPINDGPQHFVVQAALDGLNRWITHGTLPPNAPPLRLSSMTPPEVARDGLGNAIGGVRTPLVDVPVAALTGKAPPGASILCSLFGSTAPFDRATLLRLYHDQGGYLSAFTRSLDGAIAGRFLLASDRTALLTKARDLQFPS
jgi:hypothetical protein